MALNVMEKYWGWVGGTVEQAEEQALTEGIADVHPHPMVQEILEEWIRIATCERRRCQPGSREIRDSLGQTLSRTR